MDALRVENLRKSFPGFQLMNVSFAVEQGHVMGLIGRNGAGKTTVLKSLLNLVHPDSGRIEYWGTDISETGVGNLQRIGYAAGTNTYYKKKTLNDIVSVTRRFYSEWNDSAWEKFRRLFALDMSKRPEQLSEGMKVKFNLALALSHGAKILILDEPTSGLDPVSRNDVLEILLTLAHAGTSILFSTHIISDLEKCADDITYLRHGRIVFSGDEQGLTRSYVLAHGHCLSSGQRKLVVGHSLTKEGDAWLIPVPVIPEFPDHRISQPSLEEIMVNMEGDGHADTASV
ncbi:MAG: ABC transporter ATP-binding protein [Bifidobacterium sp.]|jgi:ABC-2 type transport system ATP-binding protein|nr:ABC transporter ATP-binding protein [Bifidobacterium sp.]